MPFNGAINILLNSLVKKKHALPRSVLMALYDWVMGFNDIELKMPVVWFQTVLNIAQAYGSRFPD